MRTSARVEYDGSCERLLVFGRHTVARYYTANGKQYAGTINITDVPLCVFHYYEAFDEIEASLKRLHRPRRPPAAFAPIMGSRLCAGPPPRPRTRGGGPAFFAFVNRFQKSKRDKLSTIYSNLHNYFIFLLN